MTEAHQVQPRSSSVVTLGVGTAVISSFLFGYSICVLNTCLDLMAVSLRWCNNAWDATCQTSQNYEGLVNAIVYLGAALGALSMGRSFLLPLGCRLQLVWSAVFFGIGALACAFAPGVITIACGRFISGIGLGMSVIATPMYIAEIAPRERRGAYAAMNGVLITVGILSSITCGLPQGTAPTKPGETLQGLDAWFWRFLLGLPAFAAVLQIVMFLKVCPTDSPAMLVQRGDREGARRVLHQIYGLDSKQVLNIENQDFAALELQLNDLVEAAESAKHLPQFKAIEAVRDRFFRLSLFIGVGLAAFQQLCGINALMSYSNSLFQEAGIQPCNLTLASTLMALANVLSSILSSRLVDSWGRRKLLLFGALGQTLAMGLLILALSTPSGEDSFLASARGPVTVVCFSLFVTTFSAGLGAIVWLYLSEIYPQEIRGAALSVCGITNWVSSFAVVYGGKFLSLKTSCCLFGGICAVGLVAIYIWIVETKGCSLDDSPLTPRSERSSSVLLSTPPRSPRCDYSELADDVEGDMSDVETEPSTVAP